ncbi:DUF92 domain-containing protein [bacterium]|nr:DUF92 domain-containing protein [bacterium]
MPVQVSRRQTIQLLQDLVTPLAILVGLLIANRLSSLTLPAAGVAWLLAVLLLLAAGLKLVLIAFLFLATSSLFTRWPGRSSQRDHPRRTRQVIANGIVAGICALLAILLDESLILRGMIVGSFAAATADTWASEWGAGLGGRPLSLRSFKLTRAGESGAISVTGTIATLAGSALIAASAKVLGLIPTAHVPIITVAGFAGSLLDSMAGAWLQAAWKTADGQATESRPESGVLIRGIGWIDNDIVNVIATLTGALVAGSLIAYVPVG